ncbi:MAG: aerotolerance regulator BatC [Bacteroidetes bacterium CG23_combo_of_CG06-09_8_20_14_all_32_9]|nr:MAG: aerotolerance regulator BatC [Bacteroidetes bacterium CG23_combo_of_CG06-09_8_20_14_all_32_9]
MKALLIILTLLLLFAVNSTAQTDKKQIREGNKLYKNKKFRESEVSYQKALKKDPKSFKANFNLGDALYKQEKYEEAVKQFTEVEGKSGNKTNSAKVYHNLGNSYLLKNKIDESISAYKNALRNNPRDMATKYNLAYAQALKKKQEQQKKQQNQNQNQQQKQQKQEQKKDNKQQQPKDQQMSKEDADRMLKALQDDEKNTQDKVKKIQAQRSNQNIEKDW